jgi:type I restriction enzyme S subunit
LGEITNKIGSGATPKGGGESYKDSGISLIRSQNILDFKFSTNGLAFIDDSQAYELRNVSVEANDVLLNITGDSVARCCVVPENILPARVNQHVAIIRADKKIADNHYIFYSLQALKEELLMQSEIGATRNALTKGMLENLKISIPALEEQKAIASVLSSLDDKIDLLHRQNTTLERMAETLFRQWFVEEAQEDWEVVPLGDLFEISSGKGLKKDQLSDTGLYPVLGANGEIGKTNDFLFNEKLIFTGRVGTLGSIFRVNNEKVWLSDNTLIFRNIKYFYFVYFALNKAGLSDYNVGSTQPLIRQSDIKAIEILMPRNRECLNKFETEAELIFAKLNSNNKQIQTLEKLRNNLLPKLMSGEVRVVLQGASA